MGSGFNRLFVVYLRIFKHSYLENMEHQVLLSCPHCKSANLTKNGHRPNGTQRWRCKSCQKSFQLDYTYNANKPGVEEQIITLTLNACGVMDTARALKISKGTVSRTLKKKRQPIKTNML